MNQKPFLHIPVCGIDVGSFRTLSYVAWLKADKFLLDLYIPSIEYPLPEPPKGWKNPVAIGIDAPQGLPASCKTIRDVDLKVSAPTKRLPTNRKELATWRLYQGLIEAGVNIFWTIYERKLASIAGLDTDSNPNITVLETYPRYVFKRLWPKVRIPSKKTAPKDYVDRVWDLIRKAGYSCDSVLRPSVDHIDAMLCALAAEAYARGKSFPPGTVGLPPQVDEQEKVIREGLIVSP